MLVYLVFDSFGTLRHVSDNWPRARAVMDMLVMHDNDRPQLRILKAKEGCFT